MGDEKGYTLIELIVTTAIFVVVIMIISVTFNNLVSQGGQQARSATGQIEGIVGLEMLRADIVHAGYALPWSFQNTPAAYNEVDADTSPKGAPSDVAVASTAFNNLRDIPPNVPRAVVGAVTTNGSHYLVLKSALLALNSTSVGRWGFVQYSTSSKSHIRTIGDPTSDVQANRDYVITLRSIISASGAEDKQLIVDSVASPPQFSYIVPADPPPYVADADFQPADATQSFYAYAISDTNLRMPYNRADYFIDFSAAVRPTSCNPGTGVLYKAVAGHSGDYKAPDGTSMLLYPLLNCVGDMQVILTLDPNNNGQISYVPIDSAVLDPPTFTAQDLREQLKSVRVYILAHEGKKDWNFSYPDNSIRVGEPGIGGRTLDQNEMNTKFGAGWRNYRWKVYSFVANMSNL